MGIWSPGPGATGGADVFTGDDSNETADGLGGADILNGNRGADTLTGNDGDDTLRPGDDYVADIVSGGANYDILDYSSLVEDGIIFLGTISYRSYFDNSSLWDMLSGVEEVIGTAASDLIFARPDGPNVLRGGAGNDFMTAQNTTTNPDFYGGAGRDYFSSAPIIIASWTSRSASTALPSRRSRRWPFPAPTPCSPAASAASCASSASTR